MRIAPAAIYFQDDADELFEAVMAASLMTHRDIRSLAGAMAVAFGVRRLLAGEDREPSFLFRVAGDVQRAESRIAAEYPGLVTSIGSHGRAISSAIAQAEKLVDLPRDRALALLVEEANKHGAEPACRRATMGFPPAMIPTCLYLLVTTETFEEAILEVVNLGGDADTAGAILGALAGAHFGDAAIPERLLDGLKNHAGVALRGEALARRDGGTSGIPDLVKTERELSREEESCRGELLALRQGGDLGANRRS
jgi:ADP-ribosylglycohydrolase